MLTFALPSLITFISYPLLVRALGAEKFGVFILATTLSTSLMIFDLGLGAATMKCLAEDFAQRSVHRAEEILGTSLVLYGGLGLVVGGLASAFAHRAAAMFGLPPRLETDSVTLVRLASAQLLLVIVNNILVVLFKSRHRFDQSALSLICGSILVNGSGLLAIYGFHQDLVGLMSATLAGSAAMAAVSGAIGSASLHQAGIQVRSLRFSKQACGRLFAFGSAMATHSFIALFFAQGQRIVAGLWVGTSGVAIYTLGSTVSTKAHSFIAACTEFLFPLASVSQNGASLRSLYWKLTLGSVALTAAVLVPLAVFARPLLGLWLPAETAAAVAPILPVLCLGAGFLAISPVPFYFLNGRGLPWFNVAFDILNLSIAAACLAFFSVNGRSLMNICWAYSIANVANGLAYQFAAARTLPGRLSANGSPAVATQSRLRTSDSVSDSAPTDALVR